MSMVYKIQIYNGCCTPLINKKKIIRARKEKFYWKTLRKHDEMSRISR